MCGEGGEDDSVWVGGGGGSMFFMMTACSVCVCVCVGGREGICL